MIPRKTFHYVVRTIFKYTVEFIRQIYDDGNYEEDDEILRPMQDRVDDDYYRDEDNEQTMATSTERQHKVRLSNLRQIF